LEGLELRSYVAMLFADEFELIAKLADFLH